MRWGREIKDVLSRSLLKFHISRSAIAVTLPYQMSPLRNITSTCIPLAVPSVARDAQRPSTPPNRPWAPAERFASPPPPVATLSDPFRQLYHKVLLSSSPLWLFPQISQPCLSCLICKKRLDSFSLVEHDQEACLPHISASSSIDATS
jgi:hypothetical protein